MKIKPEISIIMYCCGSADDTILCIESILLQCFSNFELFVYVPVNKARKWKKSLDRITDPRVVFIDNSGNLGIYEVLNLYSDKASSLFLCYSLGLEVWLDNKLLNQSNYMRMNRQTGIAGGRVKFADQIVFPENPSFSTELLLQFNPFVLSTLIIRKSLWKKHGLMFDESSGTSVFYRFINNAVRCCKMSILSDILITSDASAREKIMSLSEQSSEENKKLRAEQLRKLKLDLSQRELIIYNKLLDFASLDPQLLEAGCDLLNKVLDANSLEKVYSQKRLKKIFIGLLSAQLQGHQQHVSPLKRNELLNALINRYGYSSYLEIGVFEPGQNFDLINCHTKTGVDPEPRRSDILGITSDSFFEQLPVGKKFDLIFIDGLHHAEQVHKDISNAVNCLTENGTIVCHDMLPANEEMQLVPRQSSTWMGDCWKVWAHLRLTDTKLKMHVVDSDCGLGIIRHGEQAVYEPAKIPTQLNYEFFRKHKKKLMNVITVAEFQQLLQVNGL